MKQESDSMNSRQIFEQCNNFFSDIHKDLEQIVFDSRVQQRKIHHNKKMNIIDQKSKPNTKRALQKKGSCLYKQQKVPPYQSFISNVVIDFLKSRNYNYCYNVFMRQSNTISEQIMAKGKIAQIIGVKKEHDLCVGNQVSLIELMIQKVCNLKTEVQQKQVQTIDTSTVHGQSSIALAENRINEVRQETEERQRRHYEKVVKSMKNKQMLEIRQSIAKQYEQKLRAFKQQSHKIQSQHQLKNSQTKQLNISQKLKQAQKMKEAFQKLERQNLSLKDQLKTIHKQQIQHLCNQNPQFKERQKKIAQQRKYLQKKAKEYELALRNMGTKVQDFCRQKQIVNRQGKATDIFVQDQKKFKETKNFMIEQIHGQLKKMQMRLQHLCEDNNKLRQQNRQLNQKIKHTYQDQKGQQAKKYVSSFYSQLQNINNTKNALIGVTQKQISAQFEQEQNKKKMDISNISENSEQIIDKIEKKYQHEEKISKIFSDMKLLKNKVRFLVQDFKTS